MPVSSKLWTFVSVALVVGLAIALVGRADDAPPVAYDTRTHPAYISVTGAHGERVIVENPWAAEGYTFWLTDVIFTRNGTSPCADVFMPPELDNTDQILAGRNGGGDSVAMVASFLSPIPVPTTIDVGFTPNTLVPDLRVVLSGYYSAEQPQITRVGW